MIGLLSARELVQLRQTQDAAATTSCVIRTTPEVADTQGGTTAGAPVDMPATCRIGPPAGDERIIAERIGQVIDVVLTVSVDHAGAISERSQVLVPDAAAPTAIYDVVFVSSEQSYLAGVRLACQRIK